MSAVDAQIVVTATGLLRTFNEAGALSAADVHVARRLGRLGGESDQRVLLGVALAVRAARGGSVCVWPDQAAQVVAAEDGAVVDVPLPWPTAAEWDVALTASPLVAVGPDGDPRRPVRWVDGRLYLDRYWRHEQVVRTEMDARLSRTLTVDADAVRDGVDSVYDDRATGPQRLASVVAAVSGLTVLTGGPGTGKTTTVARVLAVLASLPDPPRRVALAAPTGRAAARLQEAVRAELQMMGSQHAARVGDVSASTLHRLLGWRPGTSTRFRHDRWNRLPHDLVVVDETSMVSLTLMSRLLEALRPDARLVLVGDPDQLASVEAGAVLGDLVARPVPATVVADATRHLAPQLVTDDASAALAGGVVRLVTVHRYGGGIHQLAEAVRVGDGDGVVQVLRSGLADVRFEEQEPAPGARAADEATAAVRADVVASARSLVTAARSGDVRGALQALDGHRLLVAHRRGPAGVAHWTALVEGWLEDEGLGPQAPGEWYPGRPLLVTANDRDTGLYNGDTGVVVDDGNGGVLAAFGTPQSPVLVAPHRLPAVQTVHAMTVHRGQGSQFRHVSLVLPADDSPLLTRELLYTAVTRARELVRVVGSADAVRAAVERPVRRASGLREAR